MALIHRVSPGETLWEITRRYGVSLDVLRAHNNLTSDVLHPGDTLVIPTTSQSDPQDPQDAELPSIEGGFAAPDDFTPEQLDDLSLMARLVYAEARGEPYEGQVAVAAVVLNRVKHPEFPNTIFDVIYQSRQFEPVMNGAINNVPNNKAYQASLEAMSGEDPSEGALFFWNPHKVPKSSWVWTREPIKRIGDHIFAR